MVFKRGQLINRSYEKTTVALVINLFFSWRGPWKGGSITFNLGL